MIVLVTGGRDYENRNKVYETLYQIHSKTPITLLMQGGANGADKLADDWAQLARVPRMIVPADWGKHGLAAGPTRNSLMINWLERMRFTTFTMVVAFPGGKGTAHMVKLANKLHHKVLEVS